MANSVVFVYIVRCEGSYEKVWLQYVNVTVLMKEADTVILLDRLAKLRYFMYGVKSLKILTVVRKTLRNRSESVHV